MIPVYRRSAVLGAVIATFACASVSPAPPSGAEPTRPSTPVEPETRRPSAATPVRATFAYAPGAVSFVVTSEATVAELDSAGASAPRTFQETARLHISVSPATDYTLVTTTGTSEGSSSTMITVAPFVDTLRTANTDTIVEPRMPICGRDTVPPMHLVTLLPPVPLELHEGLAWQRRSVYAACQGSIPIRIERTDTYSVIGRASEVNGIGVNLSRNSSLSFAGAGVEGQHNVRVSGSGTAQATFVLDASAGHLLSAVEESTAEIAVTASGRTRRFLQRVAKTVGRQ